MSRSPLGPGVRISTPGMKKGSVDFSKKIWLIIQKICAKIQKPQHFPAVFVGISRSGCAIFFECFAIVSSIYLPDPAINVVKQKARYFGCAVILAIAVLISVGCGIARLNRMSSWICRVCLIVAKPQPVSTPLSLRGLPVTGPCVRQGRPPPPALPQHNCEL